MSCKHEWVENTDPLFGTPIRRCKKCGRRQKLVIVDILKGTRRWRMGQETSFKTLQFDPEFRRGVKARIKTESNISTMFSDN